MFTFVKHQVEEGEEGEREWSSIAWDEQVVECAERERWTARARRPVPFGQTCEWPPDEKEKATKV
jgi:hypothetical protein